jgi:hypothetical protein
LVSRRKLYGGQSKVPGTLVDLRTRITAAITVIDHNMLQRVWQELDYRLDVCRVTGGAHVEHL